MFADSARSNSDRLILPLNCIQCVHIYGCVYKKWALMIACFEKCYSGSSGDEKLPLVFG